jgi:predicted DNA-binding protein (MmcQ/YjbR family)
MSVEFVREVSMALPNVTEQIQWEDHLLFKVGGKMFAITTLGPVGVRLSVKSTPEKFAELTEIPGVIPAPYMARNFWVALERWDAVRRAEMEDLIRESYGLVLAKLPKRKQAELAGAAPKKKPSASAPVAAKSKAKKSKARKVATKRAAVKKKGRRGR